MRRKHWQIAVVSWAVATAIFMDLPSLGRPDHVANASANRVPNLEETLNVGLRSRRPQEFAFIGRVVRMVEEGDLPLSLVKGTFGWARRKRPYPFPYFQRALRLRAAALGIVVE